MEKFCRDVSKELAARLLGFVIPRSPVGVYKNRKYIKEHGFAGGSSVEADVKYEISCSEAAPLNAIYS